jgi:hypothetical protein
VSVFTDWTCVFPGKTGISWKRAWDGVGTKEEAEDVAARSCNVVAVPLEMYLSVKRFEWRTVTAERKLQELGILVRYDENDNPTFVTVK